MKNRVLLLTSALQVVYSKASIEFLNYNDEKKIKTHVLMIHPTLNEYAKNSIRFYSNKFKFNKIYDLTYFFKDEKKKKFNYTSNFINFCKYKVKNIKHNIYFNNIERPNKILEISKFIKLNIGDVDEVFIRTNYKALDLAFYQSMPNIKTINIIEDGFYDFLKANNFMGQISFVEFKHFLRYNAYVYLIFFLSYFQSFKIKECIQNNLTYKIKANNKFNSFNNKNAINIGPKIKTIFKDYSDIQIQNKRDIVIIAGTFFWESEFYFNDEIQIYNELISEIIKKFSINNSDIYYKPHPRCLNVSLKKNKLNCKILKNINNILLEEYIANYNVKAIYSLGSTSLLFSKIFFNIPSYYIDVNNFKRGNKNYNYKIFRKNEYLIFKKLGVKKIEII